MFIRVLLADDSRIMRDAIRSFLSGHSEIALVGEAVDFFANDRNGLRSKTANPLDLHIPNCVGLDLTQTSNRLKAMDVPVLAMSVWTDMRLT